MQALRERMHAGRKLAEAVRSVLPGCGRSSATPEAGLVSRSGRGRKVKRARDATPTPEPAPAEPQEASIDSLQDLLAQGVAQHLVFPELEALREAVASYQRMKVCSGVGLLPR